MFWHLLPEDLGDGTETIAELFTRKAHTDGRAEGRREERATVLLRLLDQRFGALPAELHAKVERAGWNELDRWTDRLLSAPTLEAVFAEG